MKTPDRIFQELFADLHLSGIWLDGKMISDAIPKASPEVILRQYRLEKQKANFDLKAFFNKYFQKSASASTTFKSDTSRPVEQHIEILWDILQRKADEEIAGSSLIPLPYPYIVPGGRFNEIYYWDSYFTMLGLQVSGRIDVIENMVNNFSWLIEQIGFIPNGNRTYFLGRSQPPFYALMLSILAEEKGESIFIKYRHYLEKEYAFWMNGKADLSDEQPVIEHLVQVEGGILNRYYDRFHEARAEMYAADKELEEDSHRSAAKLFLDIRAACESGWDFSSRWMDDPMDLTTIRASDILPVDLNCLLYFLEQTIAKAHHLEGNLIEAEKWNLLADKRKALIIQYFWDDQEAYFRDYDFVYQKQTTVLSMAGVYPLFFKIASVEQAEKCATTIQKHFLRPGGLVSTSIHSGQQWDAPNGWAPLQWMGIKGLRNYGFEALANQVKSNWTQLNKEVYQRTGKLLEKYNVEDTSLLSGGGEYPVQDGFGWTNGVLLKLLSN